MIRREEALTELYERLRDNYQDIGLKTYRRNPTKALNDDQFPYIIMDEGVDQVIDKSKRGRTGHQQRRVLEVIFEIGINNSTEDIKTMFLEVRKALFAQRGTSLQKYNNVLAENTFIEENRTEGPTGVDIPDILVMRLVLDLIYTDNGF